MDALAYARFRDLTPLFDGELIPDLCVYVDAKHNVIKRRLLERDDKRRYSGHYVEAIRQLFEGVIGMNIIGHHTCRVDNNTERDLKKTVRKLTEAIAGKMGDQIL